MQRPLALDRYCFPRSIYYLGGSVVRAEIQSGPGFDTHPFPQAMVRILVFRAAVSRSPEPHTGANPERIHDIVSGFAAVLMGRSDALSKAPSFGPISALAGRAFRRADRE